MLPDLTLVGALSLAVSALSGAVIVMFKWMVSEREECRRDCQKLQDKYESVLKLLAPEVFQRRATDAPAVAP